jgi:hypothetical protein
MGGESKVDAALQEISADPRTTVWHISLYVALLHSWYRNSCQSPFQISRGGLMKFAHIGSIATYHKCIKQLQEFGYIAYLPFFNPFTGSMVYLLDPSRC